MLSLRGVPEMLQRVNSLLYITYWLVLTPHMVLALQQCQPVSLKATNHPCQIDLLLLSYSRRQHQQVKRHKLMIHQLKGITWRKKGVPDKEELDG